MNAFKYDPEIHHRKSIRLKGYDYTIPASYFITICTESRGNELGIIIKTEMFLNSVGEMVDKWLKEIENKFIDLTLEKYVIMPNHIHFIATTKPIVTESNINEGIVGADLYIRPERSDNQTNLDKNIERTAIRSNHSLNLNDNNSARGGYINPPLQSNICTSLSKIVQWFKIMTTDECIKNVKSGRWQPFNKRFWQRNFYDHIIRNDREYENICNYIQNNPLNWFRDIENKKFCNMITEKQREEYYKKLIITKK